MKIAIWGSYNYGNFGDDLMAVMLSKYLTTLGAEPVVYRLDNHLASLFHIKNTFSIDDLLKDARFCIIGGGNFLEAHPFLETDWREFLESVDLYSVPVHMVSVGGDGLGSSSALTYYQWKFLESPHLKESTVRLPRDVDILSQAKKKAEYHPDIVFLTEKFWLKDEIYVNSPSKGKSTVRVGINLPKSREVSALSRYLSLIGYLRGIEFYFISSHLPNYSLTYEFLPRSQSPAIKIFTYTNPDEMIEFISSLNLLVSSKLHLGVTALSRNVPFYSFGGAPKTKAFLHEIGCDHAISVASKSQFIYLLKLLSSKKNISDLIKKFDFERINLYKRRSLSHLSFVREVFERYS
jgi:polysaccharide pyruvyl transferase WcaK-like protein